MKNTLRWIAFLPGVIAAYVVGFYAMSMVLVMLPVPLGDSFPKMLKLAAAGWNACWIAGKIPPRFQSVMSIAVWVGLLVLWACLLTAKCVRYHVPAGEIWMDVLLSTCGLVGAFFGFCVASLDYVNREFARVQKQNRLLSLQ